MKIVSIRLLILAATLVAVPLWAEDINAPEPHWNDTAAATTASAASAAPVAPIIIKPAVISEGEDKHQKAEAQIKEQEGQRVLGLLPSFNVSYRSDAVSLTGIQKMRLAFRSSTDPVTVATSFGIAGYHEVMNDLTGFRWGVRGYGERAGAAYLDSFDSNMLGNGIFPALLHQDPRFFRMGHGSFPRRLVYAVASQVIAKHDNTGKWEPNYSNVAGNIAAGAISNLYYPGSNSGFGLTISNGLIQTATGAIGSVFQEFWPDVSRKVLHRDPTRGLDAQYKLDSQRKLNAAPAAADPPPDKP